MSKKSRRSFIAVTGAALSAPVAAAAAGSSSWLPPSRGRTSTLEARLAHLEDVNAIRALNQALARHVTSGAHEEPGALAVEGASIATEPGVCGMSLDDYGARDEIEVDPDRQTATARVHVTLHSETEIGPPCTLVEMARQQGSGVITASAQAVLENAYVRRDGVWKILSSTRHPA